VGEPTPWVGESVAWVAFLISSWPSLDDFLDANIYNGYVKRLIISHKINNKLKHVQEEQRWGKVYTKWARVRNCKKKCGTNPASNDPIPLSAISILYEGDTSDLLAELRASHVQTAMYRYPREVTGTGTHFPIM
jgi:hypothetical protein